VPQTVTLDTRLTAPQICARYGNISDMTLWRWLRNAALGFPKPMVINRRRYWRLAEIEAWERAQASKSDAA
jgi:predicted DNA-binding transcriptional regulator AlpA